MSRMRTTVVGVAASLVIGVSAADLLPAQSQSPPPPPATRTEKGLYLKKVVEPGYDVTVTEMERAAKYSLIELKGLVPTITASGMVMFRGIYDIAKERGMEFTFTVPQPSGSSTTGPDGRRVMVLTKVFMTNDGKTLLKDLLGADYTADAQKQFDTRGYQTVTQLAMLFGGRGM